MNVIAKISCYFEHCRYTKIAQRMFKYSDTQYTSLTPDKILNNMVYRTLFYVNIYGSFKLSRNSPVFWPTLYISLYNIRLTKFLTYCVSNSSAQNYQNRLMCVEVIVRNITVVFLTHSMASSNANNPVSETRTLSTDVT